MVNQAPLLVADLQCLPRAQLLKQVTPGPLTAGAVQTGLQERHRLLQESTTGCTS